MPRRFSQLDLVEWSDRRSSSSRTATAKRRERLYAAIAHEAAAFHALVRSRAEPRGIWSEIWFPRVADPAAVERARLSASSLRARVARAHDVREARFLEATAQWLDVFADEMQGAHAVAPSLASAAARRLLAARDRWHTTVVRARASAR